VAKKSSKKKSSVNKKSTNATAEMELSDLLLDGDNPRLGHLAGKLRSQREILDEVVDTFGVDDVLSSLAVNGYFEAEPMVVVKDAKSKYRVAEGNRRLAACLILSGDERARNHERRTKEYQQIQKQYGQKKIERVPVRVLADDHSLLSYLGVRHIAASQPWDSYAKAAWIAKILDESALTLEDVSKMIGDQHRTIARALEGFYFVNQLRKNAQFNPEDSLRPGRGSNPQYPFSWVYTALGYGPVREWLELDELTEKGREKKPIPKEKLGDGGDLLVFLFGNKSKGRAASISDSRQIGDLAKGIANPESRRLLKRGKTVNEIEHLLKPARDRVSDNLLDAQDSLNKALTPLVEGEISASDASDLLGSSKKVRSVSNEVNRKIVDLMNSDEE
jgi:hypothetical protein